LARHSVIHEEDRAQFLALLASLHAGHQPVGPQRKLPARPNETLMVAILATPREQNRITAVTRLRREPGFQRSHGSNGLRGTILGRSQTVQPVPHATQSKSPQKQNAAIEPIMALIPKKPRHLPIRKRTQYEPTAAPQPPPAGGGAAAPTVPPPRWPSPGTEMRSSQSRDYEANPIPSGLREPATSGVFGRTQHRPPAASPQAPSAPLGAPPPVSAVLAPMEGGQAHPCPARPPVLLSSVLGSNGRILFPS
jgi:hypothetical protein